MTCYGFLTFVALLVCLGNNYVLCSDEEASLVKAALKPHMVACAEEFGITEEQYEEAKKNGKVEDVDPCFMSCFLKKAEFFDSDGKFDADKTMAFAKAKIENEEAIKFMQAVSEECVRVNDEDVSDGDKGCDRAKLLFDCVQEIKKKMDG